MSEHRHLIRLLGGPPGLADRVIDLSVDPCDRADATGDRFLRAARGTVVGSFAGLQARCRDRAGAERLAGTWRLVEYHAIGRGWGRRPRRYRYRGTRNLRAVRDEHGRWGLAPDDGHGDAAVPPCGGWEHLEAALDRAAERFATVAALLPDGPMAERALETRRAVGSCVADAARLCAVGAALADDAPEAAELERRVEDLVARIDAATAHLVDLHLRCGTAVDPGPPLACLGAAWAELDGR
jgi:hypothetical protein